MILSQLELDGLGRKKKTRSRISTFASGIANGMPALLSSGMFVCYDASFFHKCAANDIK